MEFDGSITEVLNLAMKLIGGSQLSSALLQVKLQQANETIKAQAAAIKTLMEEVNGVTLDPAPGDVPDVPVQPVS